MQVTSAMARFYVSQTVSDHVQVISAWRQAAHHLLNFRRWAKKAIAVGLHADELQRLLKAAATMFVACTVVWLRKWRSQFK